MMRLPVGCSDRELRILFGAGTMQAHDEIARQERTVSRRAQNPRNVRPMGSRPVEGGQNACERSWRILRCIGNDREAEACEARRIAIGTENESVALRLEPRDHARQ